MNQLKKYLHSGAVCLLICLAFVFAKLRQVKNDPAFIPQSYAISWDIYGYYLYLPATFIYHDIGLEQKDWVNRLNEQYHKDRPFYQAWQGKDNRLVDAYPSGTAVAWLPFFFASHVYAGLAGYEQDGLSAPYQYGVIIGGLTYAIIGLFLMRILLLRFFDDHITSLLLLIIGMGTNLYWYGSYDSSMPHIYLFAIDCAILLLTISWHEKPSVVKAVGLGLLLGWGVITRPSEVVWVFIPLLWGVYNLKTLQQKIRLLLQFKHHVFFLAMAACLPGIMQMSYWYYTTGHLLSYNHGEAFDFLHPFTIKALFSYKKGWLLYTPVMIFAIAGFVFLYKKKKELFWPLFVFFISNLYIITSWECWWYAGTFGQRPFVQSYGLMAIPLGFLLDAFRQRRTLYLSLLSVLSVLTLFNQFQAWQMKNGIIHSELMTKEYYWAVFGKTTYDRSLTRYLEVDRNNLPPLHSSENDYIKTVVYNAGYESPGETGPFQLLCDTFGYNSQHSTLLNQEKQFVKNWESPFDALTQKNYLRFRISADFYFTEDVTDKPVYFTFGMIGIRDQSYGYQAVPVQPDSMHKWVHHEMEFVTPPVLHRSDKIIMNIWNQGGTPVYIDNVRIEMFNPKEAYGY